MTERTTACSSGSRRLAASRCWRRFLAGASVVVVEGEGVADDRQRDGDGKVLALLPVLVVRGDLPGQAGVVVARGQLVHGHHDAAASAVAGPSSSWRSSRRPYPSLTPSRDDGPGRRTGEHLAYLRRLLVPVGRVAGQGIEDRGYAPDLQPAGSRDSLDGSGLEGRCPRPLRAEPTTLRSEPTNVSGSLD